LIGGGLTVGVASIVFADSPYTVPATVGVILCDATNGAVTITTGAAASTLTGRQIMVKKTDSSVNSCTWDANGAETTDGASTKTNIIQYQAFTFTSNGTNWFIF
jgi:hypothetical protein